jgi:hypothetical protein
MVLFGVLLMGSWTFMRAKHLVIGCASKVFALACTALLSQLMWRLLMLLFMQHDSK